MPEEETEQVVYLEDVQSTSVAVRESSDAMASTAKAAVTAVKRQRTLMDMLTPAGGSKSSLEPSAKRLKVAAGGTASTSKGDASGLQHLNSIPFSLSALQESFTEEQRGLLKLECEVMGKSWLKLLKDEIKKPYFIALKKFLSEEGVRSADDTPKSCKVYPSARNIYSWSNLTPIGKVKVVIIGQDPYHGPGQAHGLCFSVPPGVPIPPSLRNIYAEIKAEYPEFEAPKHGNLTAWAENGVLMLNTCLTVRSGQAGSHSGRGWEAFTDKVISTVDKYGGATLPSANGVSRGVVFLCWGAWAAKRTKQLDKKKHLILSSAHPSPLSAHRGFLGNGHFKAANDWLLERYGAEGRVDWCRLDGRVQGEF